MSIRQLLVPAGTVAAIAATVLSGPSAHAGTGGPQVEPVSFSRTVDCGGFTIEFETSGHLRTMERTGPDGTTRTRTVYLVESTFTGPTGAVVEGRLRGGAYLVLEPDGSGVLRETVTLLRKAEGGPTLVSRAGNLTIAFTADGTETVLKQSGQQQDVTPQVCAALAP